jgi:hypothetical protein
MPVDLPVKPRHPAHQVFIEFYESSLDEVPHYVGTDFAINSIMLIAIAWLFPYF